MLFWTRASLCIGAITVLAIQRLPSAPPPVPAAATRWPIDLASAACRARPDICATAIVHGWQALAPSLVPSPNAPRKPARSDGARPTPVAIAGRSLT